MNVHHWLLASDRCWNCLCLEYLSMLWCFCFDDYRRSGLPARLYWSKMSLVTSSMSWRTRGTFRTAAWLRFTAKSPSTAPTPDTTTHTWRTETCEWVFVLLCALTFLKICSSLCGCKMLLHWQCLLLRTKRSPITACRDLTQCFWLFIRISLVLFWCQNVNCYKENDPALVSVTSSFITNLFCVQLVYDSQIREWDKRSSLSGSGR